MEEKERVLAELEEIKKTGLSQLDQVDHENELIPGVWRTWGAVHR